MPDALWSLYVAQHAVGTGLTALNDVTSVVVSHSRGLSKASECDWFDQRHLEIHPVKTSHGSLQAGVTRVT